MKKLNQKGSSIVALFVVVIVLVIAGGMYYLYRSAGKQSDVNNYDACVAANGQIQESYPEVCVTEDGKRFPNPSQSLNQVP